MKPTIPYSLITALLLTNALIADERLEDITVISATQTSQKLEEITSNVDVITGEELEERHYTDIADALNSLAGIDLNQNGGLGQNADLYLRGFDNNKILVLIDGIRYNDVSSLSGAALSHLMIRDIEQIEVIKGVQSGIWGADASAGVINIRTKKAAQGFHLHASEMFGRFDTVEGQIGVSYRNDTYSLQASHNQIRSKGFSSYAPRGADLNKLEDDGYTNETTALKAGFQINATNKIDLSHTVIDTDTEADPFDATTYAFNPNGQYDIESKTKLSGINYYHIDSFNEVNIFAKQSTFERYYPQDAFSQHFKGEVNEYGLTSKIPYGKAHFLLWGGEYKKFADQGIIDQDYNNKALFVTNNNTFDAVAGGDIILTESLRRDGYSAFDDQLTGKIGVKYSSNALEGFSTGINYGTAYNVPTHYHLYDAYSGNPALNPEKTKGVDITCAYQDLKVTYFDNRIEEMIEYQSNFDAEGNWIGGEFQNVSGTSKLKGVEVGYQKDLFDTILLSLNYTRLDAKNKEGQQLARRADQTFKFGLDYYGIDRLHLGINGEYVGERFDQSDKQGQQTGKYTVANFTANYKVDKQMSLYGKVDNITDRYYQTIDGYATSPRAVYGGIKLSY